VTKHSESGALFESVKFTDWPTVKEALIAKRIGASFLLAPMAMQLRADGVPIKVVYLGHRDGSTLMVSSQSDIRDFGDLRGKIIAVPSRYANQNVLIHRMARQWKIPFDQLQIREIPPPEHPTALRSGSIDAYITGEPFAAKGEIDGIARVLYHAKDMWPGFISCVLVVHEDLIRDDRPLVQELVDGIAKSGKWIDESYEHRMDAAEVAAKHYYFQPPELLKHVLSKPPDRVRYTDLAPLKKDFDEIMRLALDLGILKKELPFEEYVDTSFVRPLDALDWRLQRLPEVTGEDEAARQEALLKSQAKAAAASASASASAAARSPAASASASAATAPAAPSASQGVSP
jgi:NitT/TauT family transport system substrate-binding protein